MKIKRIIAILLTIGLMFTVIACSNRENDLVKEEEDIEIVKEDEYYPITITTYGYDKKPREITIKEEPKSVVAIYQNSIETLLALGLEDKIIGAAGLDHNVKDELIYQFETIDYYDHVPSKEEIIGLKPDFILSWYSLFDEKRLGEVDFWHERGVNTYISQNSGVKDPNSLENEYEDIINIGKIFNVEERANKLVEDMKRNIENSTKYIGEEKVRAIILEVSKDNTYRVYGENSIGGNIATQVGADLVVKENGIIGAEDLINLNPEVIFTVYYGDSIDRDEALNAIKENKTLGTVDAVKNDRIEAIMLSEVYSSGIRTLDGIKSIINGLYPEKMK